MLRCRLGGLLHDVGKIAIPDRVLTKPGPLDDGGVDGAAHAHEIGEASCAASPACRTPPRAVRNHHERWDGGGYPDGLAGEEIPLEARIVAAVDAYSRDARRPRLPRGR